MARRVHWPQVKRWHPEDLAVVCAVAIGLMLGLSGFNHFGASWDEAEDSHYAKASLAAYRSGSPDYSLLPKGDFVELHGPAYLMASEVMATWWTSIRAGWPMLDARHFNNHISFLVGLVSLYLLTVRLAGRRAALGAFALMATQPLLMGHSFINQKDTPFMALFLASVAAGVLCSSSSTGTRTPASRGKRSVSARAKASWCAARRDWLSTTCLRRVSFACAVLAAVAVSGGVLLVYPTLPLAVQMVIVRAHAGKFFRLDGRVVRLDRDQCGSGCSMVLCREGHADLFAAPTSDRGLGLDPSVPRRPHGVHVTPAPLELAIPVDGNGQAPGRVGGRTRCSRSLARHHDLHPLARPLRWSTRDVAPASGEAPTACWDPCLLDLGGVGLLCDVAIPVG